MFRAPLPSFLSHKHKYQLFGTAIPGIIKEQFMQSCSTTRTNHKPPKDDCMAASPGASATRFSLNPIPTFLF